MFLKTLHFRGNCGKSQKHTDVRCCRLHGGRMRASMRISSPGQINTTEFSTSQALFGITTRLITSSQKEPKNRLLDEAGLVRQRPTLMKREIGALRESSMRYLASLRNLTQL